MKERLSKIYLDDYPITLMGDEATPPLSRIVRAGGKRPDDVDVVFLTSPSDGKGRPVDPEEVIDRAAEPTRPIYLRTIAREGKPIHTADPGHALSRPGVRKALGATGPQNASPPEAAAQADAEAAAEERQEEERNQEDALQDEQEARREAGEDAETQR